MGTELMKYLYFCQYWQQKLFLWLFAQWKINWRLIFYFFWKIYYMVVLKKSVIFSKGWPLSKGENISTGQTVIFLPTFEPKIYLISAAPTV